MWYTIIGLIMTAMTASAVFVGFCASKFRFIKKLARGRKKLSVLLGLALCGILLAVLYLSVGAMNTAVVFLHLFIFLVLSEAVFALPRLRRRTGKAGPASASGTEPSGQNEERSAVGAETERQSEARPEVQQYPLYLPGLCAIIITVIYLCTAAFLAFHVSETDYSLETSKDVGTLRVALIADAHIGTTFGSEGFSKHMDKLMEAEPDILLISGDFTDNSSERLDVEGCCEKLGSLDLKYGVWYAEGNHDRGFKALEPWLKLCGVHILKDESVLIDDRFYLIGRRDRSNNARLSASQLVSGLDPSKYMIMLDHQPYDYDAEAASGVDLVLSGHTHGGQMIPINHFGELIGENALYYGHEKHLNTDFIVTSGISDWELFFKTGCRSEFVIIDICE